MTGFYRNDLTPEDESLGFELNEIEDPDGAGGIYLERVRVKAVVKKLGPIDRIVKINNLATGSVAYQHQRYGTFGTTGSVGWKPYGVTCPNAPQAIRGAESGFDDDQSQPGHVPVTPKIPPDDESEKA